MNSQTEIIGADWKVGDVLRIDGLVHTSIRNVFSSGLNSLGVEKYKIIKFNPKTIKFAEIMNENCLNEPKNISVKYDKIKDILKYYVRDEWYNGCGEWRYYVKGR